MAVVSSYGNLFFGHHGRVGVALSFLAPKDPFRIPVDHAVSDIQPGLLAIECAVYHCKQIRDSIFERR